MSAPREHPDLRYLQHTPAGAEYVRQIEAQESDRHTRAAFRALVLETARPGARLFDFGAGPGVDVRFFAEQGFTVDAYDVDPLMRAYFSAHCRDFIDSGQVTLDDGTYRDFLRRPVADQRRADLVISNFAPLNLVDDLHELFGKFAALSGPQGKVLASVLNCCSLAEMRTRWWWRHAPRLWRDGQLFMPGPQAPHYRRLLRHFSMASTPHFRLSRVYCALPCTGRPAWLQLVRSRFLFLLFERTP